MASTNSGSDIALGVGASGQTSTYVEIGGTDHGLANLDISPEASTFSTTSGGLTSTNDGGHEVTTGSFSVNCDATTAAMFYGQNGRRAALRWNLGHGQKSAEAILEISRVYNPRAQVVFNVNLTVDGDIS